MKIYRITTILAIITSLFSCSKPNEPEKQYNGTIIDAGIEFSVVDSQNEDLLDPANPNHLNTGDIKLFYMVNGKKQEVYNPNLDSPRNFKIFKHAKEYRIAVFLNSTESSDKPITYVQWNDSDTDTIEATYKRASNSILEDQIWLNGEQIWERGDNTVNHFYVLTK